MQIKNIEIFQPTPITVKVGNEEVKISKIPAMATLYLYKEHDDKTNIISELLSFSTFNKDDENSMLEASRKILNFYSSFKNEINQVLSICLKKNQQWIDDNLGINEIVMVLSAIVTQTVEDATMLKKNNNQ